MTYIYRDTAGRDVGPIAEDELHAFRSAGLLSDETLVRATDSDSWSKYSARFHAEAVKPASRSASRTTRRQLIGICAVFLFVSLFYGGSAVVDAALNRAPPPEVVLAVVTARPPAYSSLLRVDNIELNFDHSVDGKWRARVKIAVKEPLYGPDDFVRRATETGDDPKAFAAALARRDALPPTLAPAVPPASSLLYVESKRAEQETSVEVQFLAEKQPRQWTFLDCVKAWVGRRPWTVQEPIWGPLPPDFEGLLPRRILPTGSFVLGEANAIEALRRYVEMRKEFVASIESSVKTARRLMLERAITKAVTQKMQEQFPEHTALAEKSYFPSSDGWSNSAYSWSDASTPDGQPNEKGGRSDERLRIGGYGDRYVSYLRFALPVRIGVEDIQSAKLILSVLDREDGTPTDVVLSRASREWRPLAPSGRFLWRDRPSSEGSLGRLSAPPRGSTVDVDLTATVRDWIADAGKNHGILLSPVSTQNNYSSFHSSRAPDERKRPRLVITGRQRAPAYSLISLSLVNPEALPVVNGEGELEATARISQSFDLFRRAKDQPEQWTGAGAYRQAVIEAQKSYPDLAPPVRQDLVAYEIEIPSGTVLTRQLRATVQAGENDFTAINVRWQNDETSKVVGAISAEEAGDNAVFVDPGTSGLPSVTDAQQRMRQFVAEVDGRLARQESARNALVARYAAQTWRGTLTNTANNRGRTGDLAGNFTLTVASDLRSATYRYEEGRVNIEMIARIENGILVLEAKPPLRLRLQVQADQQGRMADVTSRIGTANGGWAEARGTFRH